MSTVRMMRLKGMRERPSKPGNDSTTTTKTLKDELTEEARTLLKDQQHEHVGDTSKPEANEVRSTMDQIVEAILGEEEPNTSLRSRL